MAFLTLNGVPCPVALNSFSDEEPEEIGTIGRSADGSLLQSILAVKRGSQFKMTPMLQSDAQAWDGLIRGDGHVASFDSHLYTSKGLGPSLYSGVTAQTTTKKHGVGAASITSGGSQLRYSGVIGSLFTVLHWHYTGTVWEHWTRRYDGSSSFYYQNGVYNGTGDTWVTTSSGAVTFTSSGSTLYVDDVVILPYCVPASWALPLYTWHLSNPWPALPRISVNGDAIPSGPRTCIGRVTGRELLRGALGGTKYSNLTQLAVALKEA